MNDWLSYQEGLHNQEIDLGLERVQQVYMQLFANGISFKVISIAGTNGKGSTATFIDSICQYANIKVGKFSSPHILTYNERFTINGQLVNDAQICDAFEQIELARGSISLTYFEFSTLAALLIFTKQKVDIAVLEVGLGGRLDAVNIVDADVCVITNIAIDHSDYLGNTREQIGFEKTGIMRRNKPCICTDIQPPKSIQQQADIVGAKLELISTPYLGEISLLGAHQKHNAQAAIQAIAALEVSFPISQASLKMGIKNATITARLQTQTIANKTLILDVAHNPAAAKVLANELTQYQQPTLAIFAVMKDKDIKHMIEVMRSKVDKWLLPRLNNQRAIQIKDLSNQFALSDNIQACESTQQALKLALRDCSYSHIVVWGSFHLIADTIKALEGFN